MSFRSTLSSHWTRDADVEFKFPCGRSISTKIPHERYPSSMAGNTFRLISAGVTNVFSEEHLQRAPLWSAHQMPWTTRKLVPLDENHARTDPRHIGVTHSSCP